MVRIGIDFDNTIAGYDRLFNEVTREWKLLDEDFTGGKAAVRDALRLQENGEYQWQRLQGRVYGKYMERAELIEGVAPFIRRARECGAELFIVSHKTRYGHHDPERIDLREAARAWMENQRFFAEDGLALSPSALYFEETREAKVARIASLDCDCFIDDLPELFAHPDFPTSVARYLYAPSHSEEVAEGVQLCRSWAEIELAVLGECV